MWTAWKGLYDQQGIHALCVIEYLFRNLKWKGSIGGLKWATAAKTLIMYLEGTISPTIFVGTAWGLQHNNSIIFDKLWNITEVQNVLNHNLNSQMNGLVWYASEKVRNLWKEKHPA